MEHQRELFRHAEQRDVRINEGRLPTGNGHYLNYIAACTTKKRRCEETGRVLVCLPGWGGGIPVFALCLPALVDEFDAVYCVDLPGMGLSSRPQFPMVTDPTHKSITFFTNSLSVGIDGLSEQQPTFARTKQRILLAHSMGAYISTRWIMKRNNNTPFHKLILVSPAGMMSLPPKKRATSAYIPAIPAAVALVVDWCWSRGITPQSVARTLPHILARTACRRYLIWRNVDTPLVDYIYAVSRLQASADRALCTLFRPGLFAMEPLQPILPEVTMPVGFIYGEQELMDWRHGREVVTDMNVPTSLKVVPSTGHSPFRDDVPAFATALFDALNELDP